LVRAKRLLPVVLGTLVEFAPQRVDQLALLGKLALYCIKFGVGGLLI
jgi:hypothetical protein